MSYASRDVAYNVSTVQNQETIKYPELSRSVFNAGNSAIAQQ
ncbi:MAG TPA: hypothetical protein V6D25_24340 [Leptolyngbyaceae cyanobacterium]